MLFGVGLFYVDARKLYSLWVVQFIYKESLQKSKESMHCKHAISGLFRDECENTNLDGQRQARHECKLIQKNMRVKHNVLMEYVFVVNCWCVVRRRKANDDRRETGNMRFVAGLGNNVQR